MIKNGLKSFSYEKYSQIDSDGEVETMAEGANTVGVGFFWRVANMTVEPLAANSADGLAFEIGFKNNKIINFDRISCSSLAPGDVSDLAFAGWAAGHKITSMIELKFKVNSNIYDRDSSEVTFPILAGSLSQGNIMTIVITGVPNKELEWPNSTIQVINPLGTVVSRPGDLTSI